MLTPSPGVPPYDVCIITHASVWGGTERATAETAQVIAARGRRVAILQVGRPVYQIGRETGCLPASVDLHHVPIDVPFQRLSYRFWYRTLRRVPAAIYVLEKTWYGLRSFPVDILCRLGAKKYVIIENHVHSPDRPPSRRHFGLIKAAPWWWYTARTADRIHGMLHRATATQIVACSQAVGRGLREHAGHSDADISVIPYGIDCAELQFDESARRAQRQMWQIPDDCFVFGSVGRLSAVKQPDVAITAFKRFLSARPNARAMLVLAGTGPRAEELQQMILAEGLSDLVRFPGWIGNLRASLSALDCFLMPSKKEGLGLALIEAMACERPSITFNSGGPAEVIPDASLGWLVPAGDDQGFLDAMIQAWSLSPDARAALGKRARQHVVTHFDAAVQMKAVADLILS